MLKFTRKNKKLVIPVGINPSYNIDSSTLYNVSDADVVAGDIIAGKVAYGADGKIVGTLDVESEKATSFENGYAAGQEYGYESGYGVGREEGFDAGIEDQKAKLETITITENGTYNREDGYNEVIVEVPDLNGDYNEGYSDGVIAGREEIITEQSDATITPQTVFKGEIGYGANNEKIVGEYEFVEGFDFGVIGYNTEESNEVNRSISDDIAYSKTFYDRWNIQTISDFTSFFRNNKILKYVPNVNLEKKLVNTSANNAFAGCENIIYVPMLNTSNVTNMGGMFNNCPNLTTVPLFDTSNVIDMQQTFYNCKSLTSIPLFNTSNVISMSSMFQSCSKLTTVPLFDTSKVTNMSSMFSNCTNLTSIPELDFSKAELLSIFDAYTSYNSLTSLGGFINAGKGITGSKSAQFYLKRCRVLSYDSIMNVINKAYDMTTKTDWTGRATIELYSDVYSLLSPEDIAIATSKGWTIQ